MIGEIIIGANENDVLKGTKGDDLIHGKGGNDRIEGLAGNDTVKGGVGEDTLYGGAGNDVLEGGSQRNALYGDKGDDILVNKFGFVDGGAGNDVLVVNYTNYDSGIYSYGNSYYRVLDKTALTKYTSIESIKLTGTDKTDSLNASQGDTIDAAAGTDYLSVNLFDIYNDLTVDLTSTTNIFNLPDTKIKNFESIKTITTGLGDDTIRLGLTASTAKGTVNTNAGEDTLILDFTGYESGIYKGTGGFSRIGDNANLLAYQGVEHFNITGTENTDSLSGTGGDTLDGGDGVDYLTLKFLIASEDVTVDLTSSNNVLNLPNTLVKNFETIDQITTGLGNDTIKLGLTASTSKGSVNGSEKDGDRDVLILDYTGYEWGVYNASDRVRRIVDNSDLISYTGIEDYKITGTEQTDSLSGNVGDTLDGAGAKDYLTLNLSIVYDDVTVDLSKDTNLFNLPNTKIKNFEAIRQITTGQGNDTIKLDTTAATAKGSVNGNGGDDTLILNLRAYDSAVYNTQNLLSRRGEYSSLVSYQGIEHLKITGTADHDLFQGLVSSDTLLGRQGDDSLNGGLGNDILTGNAGNDTLTGGADKDVLTGGYGIDKFVYKTLKDSLLDDFDIIQGFNANLGNDQFVVSNTRAGFFDAGEVATLDEKGIAAKLDETNFASYYAAQFTFGTGNTTQTFVAINDGKAGFNEDTDAIIEVTGFTGILGLDSFTI